MGENDILKMFELMDDINSDKLTLRMLLQDCMSPEKNTIGESLGRIVNFGNDILQSCIDHELLNSNYILHENGRMLLEDSVNIQDNIYRILSKFQTLHTWINGSYEDECIGKLGNNWIYQFLDNDIFGINYQYALFLKFIGAIGHLSKYEKVDKLYVAPINQDLWQLIRLNYERKNEKFQFTVNTDNFNSISGIESLQGNLTFAGKNLKINNSMIKSSKNNLKK